MRSVTYSMGASLDGYIVGPDGTFDWTPATSQTAPVTCAQVVTHAMTLMQVDFGDSID